MYVCSDTEISTIISFRNEVKNVLKQPTLRTIHEEKLLLTQETTTTAKLEFFASALKDCLQTQLHINCHHSTHISLPRPPPAPPQQ